SRTQWNNVIAFALPEPASGLRRGNHTFCVCSACASWQVVPCLDGKRPPLSLAQRLRWDSPLKCVITVRIGTASMLVLLKDCSAFETRPPTARSMFWRSREVLGLIREHAAQAQQPR